MQRIVAEMFTEAIEGVVVDGMLLDDTSGNFDLDCEFTLLCDDGDLFKVSGWLADITILEP